MTILTPHRLRARVRCQTQHDECALLAPLQCRGQIGAGVLLAFDFANIEAFTASYLAILKEGLFMKIKNRTRLIATGLALAMMMSPAFAGWTSQTAIPTPINYAAADQIDGLVYVAGGFDTSNEAILQVFDPTSQTWTTGASMPAARYQASAGVINSTLYVTGGWSGSLPSDSLFAYNPQTNSWATLASMSHLSSCGATGSIDGKLYVTTPCNGNSGYFTLLDIYDPVANSWTTGADSYQAHSQGAAGVINGKFYVTSGINTSGVTGATTEVYDPTTNTWTTLRNIPIPVNAPASAVISGRLYVIGGVSGGSDTTVVQVYDPIQNRWARPVADELPTATDSLVGVVDYGVLFVTGGSADGSLSGATESLAVLPRVP